MYTTVQCSTIFLKCMYTTVQCSAIFLKCIQLYSALQYFYNVYNCTRVSNVIDYSLTRNYVQLRVIMFISCNFAGLFIIWEISISRNFLQRNFATFRNDYA